MRDEDGRPDEIAHWRPDAGDDAAGVLEVRRNALFAFMRDFDFDLAIFFEENRGTDEVADGWRDEDREDRRSWRCWAAEVLSDEVRVVLRCVTVIRCPPPIAEETGHPGQTLDYPISTDPDTGEPILASFPAEPNDRTAWSGAGNDNFLSPVCFKREVLDRYLSDPRYYSVSKVQVEAGGMWSLPIAITGHGNVQVWLGDLGRIPEKHQRHWQQCAVVEDDAVPEWRIRRDLHAEFVDAPRDEGLDRVRAAMDECNEAAVAYCGEPLFAQVEGLNDERIRVLHTPLNDSLAAFQHQVTSLAILLVDHINAGFFKAAGAPTEGSSLARLAGWLASTFELAEEDAKDVIGGLYAVLAIRSSGGGAHRAGSKATQVLERAEIDIHALSAGFEALCHRVADSLVDLRDRLRGLAADGDRA